MKTQHFKLSLLVALLMMVETSCTKKKITPAPDRTIYSRPVSIVEFLDKGAFTGNAYVHWGANGTSSGSVGLWDGMSVELDLKNTGIPDLWRFWAVVQVLGPGFVYSKTIESSKDQYHYDPTTKNYVVFILTGPSWNPKISSKYYAQ